MRSANYHQTGKARRRAAVTESMGDRTVDDLDNGAVASGLIMPSGVLDQDHALHLKMLLADIGEVANGDLLIRQATGEELVDMAAELGVSKQAIFQRIKRARRDLVETYRLKAEDLEGLSGRL